MSSWFSLAREICPKTYPGNIPELILAYGVLGLDRGKQGAVSQIFPFLFSFFFLYARAPGGLLVQILMFMVLRMLHWLLKPHPAITQRVSSLNDAGMFRSRTILHKSVTV
jgi:hypothetical protein